MRAAALVLAGGLLVAGPLVAASPASAAEVARPDVTVPALPGVPAAALLAHGRVLVLRPGSLEIALDGRVRRTVAVRQPLDLTQLPALVGDPSYAVRTAPDGLLLGAVLLQRPGTRVVASGVRLELADTGGAGPARLTGTRAAVDLSGVTVTASSALGVAATPGARIVTAGLRYLHDSDVRLQDVVLRGLGTPGRAGLPAVRAGGGSRVRLTGITLEAGGRGVQLDQPGPLDIEGLTADHATGDVIRVVGGSGARLSGIRTTGTAGAAVRLRATIGTTLTGLSSTGDTARSSPRTSTASTPPACRRPDRGCSWEGGASSWCRRGSTHPRWHCRSRVPPGWSCTAAACAGRRPSAPTRSRWACGWRASRRGGG